MPAKGADANVRTRVSAALRNEVGGHVAASV